MPGSFWKITALVGVLGLGCLIVLHAQQGMSDSSTNAAENFEDLDKAFDDLAGDENPLPEQAEEVDSGEGALALNNNPKPAAPAGDDSEDEEGFDWEPTPAHRGATGTSSGNPFAGARTTVSTPTAATTADADDEDDVIDAEDVIIEADGVAVNDDADSDDDILLAANQTPSPWATDTGSSSTQSGASSTQSQTPASRSPFLVLPPRSGGSTTEAGATTSAPSSAGPALQSLPSEYNSPALLPTPMGASGDVPETTPSSNYLEDDVQFLPSGPETLPRTRTSSPTVTAAATDDGASTGAVTNPFGTSSSTATGTGQPASSAPRTLSFPAAGGASSNNPSASSAPSTSSSDPFAPSSVPASQGASSIPSSIPSGPSTTSSNPFGAASNPAASDSPAPIRTSTPGRVSLDDPPAATSDAEPTPAQPTNTPANPFPSTTSPRPIDTADSTSPESARQPARITFPSVNPATPPAATGSTSPSPFPSSIPGATQSPAAATSETDPASSNPFPTRSADAPASSLPSPFPSANPAPVEATTTAPNSYVGDGTIDGIVSSSHQPELQIEKIAPPQAVVGEFVIYEIRVRNVGRSAAHQVVVEDRIPLGSELKGTIPRAELVGTQLLWRLGTMEAGAEHIIKIRVVPTAAGEIGSVATVSFRAEVAATTVVTAPALSVDMLGPREMAMGEEGAYQFTIRNDGDGEARDVVIVAMLPEGLAHPGGQELEYAVGNIAPGEVKTADIVLTAASSGSASPVVAQVTIAGQVQDQAQLDINLLESRIEVRRQGPIRRFVGRPATYSNVVTNLSSEALENVAVVEAIPSGIDLASIPEGGRFDPAQRTITWTVPRLEAHESREFRTSIVAAQEGEWEGSLVASDRAGNRAQLATQIDVAGFSSLLIDVEHAGQPVLVGEQVSMRLTIRNAGTAAARGVQATVEVPPELEFVTAQGPVAYTIDGRTVTFETMDGVGVSAEHAFDIVFTAAARGDARVRMSLSSTDLSNPIVQEQAVRIFDEN